MKKKSKSKSLWKMTLAEFTTAAKRGRLHKATGKSSRAELTAKTPFVHGRLCGYSYADIAHFYAARRGAFEPDNTYIQAQIKKGYNPFAAGRQDLIEDCTAKK